MGSPEFQREVSQLRHDIDDVYDLVDGTSKLVTKVVGVQQRHGTRLEEIQQTLDLHSGRLDRVDGRLEKIDGRLDRVDGRLEKIEDNQHQQNEKLDVLLELLRGQQPTD